MATKEELCMLRCEMVVNETWSKLDSYYDELKEIMDKGGPESDREQSIVLIAAEVALQNLTLTKAQDEHFFNTQAVIPPCGEEKNCYECELVGDCEFAEDSIS